MSDITFHVSAQEFALIPGSPIVYWLSEAMLHLFSLPQLSSTADCKHGMSTGSNETLTRQWFEIGRNKFITDCVSRQEAYALNGWFPYNKGGEFMKWYGNKQFAIRYDRWGQEYMNTLSGFRHDGRDYFFKPAISWSKISSGEPAFRLFAKGFVFDVAGCSFFPNKTDDLESSIALVNSSVINTILAAVSPTLNFEVGQIAKLPITPVQRSIKENAACLIGTSKSDWDSYETSWDFQQFALLEEVSDNAGLNDASLQDIVAAFLEHWATVSEEQRQREIRNNELVADAYGVRDEVPCDVPLERVSLKRNAAFAYPNRTEAERRELATLDLVKELISYAVGCMFGRYSLDKPDLILASQGETIDDYHAQIPSPSFEPDADNVIPVAEVDCFEDDIVSRFRRFLEVAFGKEHLTENVVFIEHVLGKTLRKYFVNDFYNDHIKTYKNRPIYWQYSSRTDNKGAFKALVYLHRYTPKTTNTVLEYLRDFTMRIADQATQLEKSNRAKDKREAEKLRKAVLECKEYENNVLYPLATRNLQMDLDDGVLVNYLRMGQALRTIPAIERKRKDVSTWTWPVYPLGEES